VEIRFNPRGEQQERRGKEHHDQPLLEGNLYEVAKREKARGTRLLQHLI